MSVRHKNIFLGCDIFIFYSSLLNQKIQGVFFFFLPALNLNSHDKTVMVMVSQLNNAQVLKISRSCTEHVQLTAMFPKGVIKTHYILPQSICHFPSSIYSYSY